MIKNALLVLLNTLGWLWVLWELYIGVLATRGVQKISCEYLANPYYQEYYPAFLDLCRLDYYFYPVFKLLEVAATMIMYYLLCDRLYRYRGILAGTLTYLNVQLVENLLLYALSSSNEQCGLYTDFMLVIIVVLFTCFISTSIWYVKQWCKA